jgi:hypothetical protein
MSDILVTLPLAFKYGDKCGLDAWVNEGDATGKVRYELRQNPDGSTSWHWVDVKPETPNDTHG